MISTIKTGNSIKNNKRAKNVLIHILMFFALCLLLYPFVCMVFVSLKSTKEAMLSPNTFPQVVHLENYREVWNIMGYEKVFFNTAFVTTAGVLGIVLFASMAAFIVAWSKHEKFYNFIYIFFLCGIMIPFYTALVPLVKLMSDLKLTNSLLGLTLYYWGRNMPMAVFLYVGFVRGISREVLEASRIDGANLTQLYGYILLPMLKPITSTIIVLDAMHLWNDFLFPRLMLISSDKRTIALSQFYFKGEYGSKYNLAFAAYMLAVIPVVVLYFCMQKYIVRGIAAGAVKG